MLSGARSQILHRRTALIVGLICLWLSTAGAMHHDDVLGITGSAHAQTVIGQVGVITHHGPCTACEWEQMIGSSQTTQVAVVMIRSFTTPRFVDHLNAPIVIRHFDYTSLRAPPVAQA